VHYITLTHPIIGYHFLFAFASREVCPFLSAFSSIVHMLLCPSEASASAVLSGFLPAV